MIGLGPTACYADVFSFQTNVPEYIYIGLTDIEVNSNFTWLDNNASDYRNFTGMLFLSAKYRKVQNNY